MRRCLYRSFLGAAQQCSGQRLPLPQWRQRGYASSVPAAELSFGQPLHETHPHLLKSGELTPGITALEYAQRRSKLANKLPGGAIAILPAAELKYRSNDVPYEFHQEPNFFYFTGFNEPDAVAVISKSSDNSDHVFHLFCREKDRRAEQWEGARSGTQAAVDVFNADDSGDINHLSRQLQPMITGATQVYTDFPVRGTASSSLFSRFVAKFSKEAEHLSKLLQDVRTSPLRELANNLRSIKSPAELAIMRAAGRWSGRAFTSAMRQQWTSEHHLAAYLDYQFRVNGCSSSAYIPVVAGGTNASVIHYTSNNDLLTSPPSPPSNSSISPLVLVDAGGEYGGYITDITRTWPVSGRFTPAQRDLYSAILGAQRHCIALCHASSGLSLDAIHDAAETHLRDSLSQIFGMPSLTRAQLTRLFPHHIGHYIGLEVHDTPGLSRKDGLQRGQCVTVEPGVYVPNEQEWPEHFRGMGIRIEDSVAVDETGPMVLTTEAVKEIDDLEALRS